MEHPVRQQPQGMPSAIPWSEEAERKLRSEINNAWEAAWIFIFGAFLLIPIAFITRNVAWLGVSIICFFLSTWALFKLDRANVKLGSEMRRGPRGEFYEGSGMLANKPRSLASLTTFFQHYAEQEVFQCACGAIHHWIAAQWIPTVPCEPSDGLDDPLRLHETVEIVDPGGGRYVILCPCGVGHFKLKQEN